MAAWASCSCDVGRDRVCDLYHRPRHGRYVTLAARVSLCCCLFNELQSFSYEFFPTLRLKGVFPRSAICVDPSTARVSLSRSFLLYKFWIVCLLLSDKYKLCLCAFRPRVNSQRKMGRRHVYNRRVASHSRHFRCARCDEVPSRSASVRVRCSLVTISRSFSLRFALKQIGPLCSTPAQDTPLSCSELNL